MKYLLGITLKKTELHYNELSDMIIRIYFDWKINLEIFGNQDNVEILKYFSNSTFHYFQKHINISILLSIIKLNDPYQNSGNKNLTLKTLLNDYNPNSDEYNLLFKKIEELEDNIKELKKHRNKFLAHNDYKLLLKEGNKPIILGKTNIDKAFKIIKEVMDIIQKNNPSFEKLSYEIAFDINNHNDMIDKMKRCKDLYEEEVKTKFL